MKDDTKTRSFKHDIFQSIDKWYIAKEQYVDEFIPGKTRIQYVAPIFGAEEVKEVVDSLLDERLAIGHRNEEFERRFASFCQTKHCLTVNSGSSALLLIWLALKNHRLSVPLKRGDEVITTALNHPATINCLIQNGLTPVLIDADLETFNMDVSLITPAITSHTKAILAMHMLGNPCDLSALRYITDEYKLLLIEDCCDAHGAMHNGVKVGSWGDLAAFSFYAAHQMTMGEGGAITFQNNVYDEIIRSLRGWGVTDVPSTSPDRFVTQDPRLPNYDRRHLFTDIGYNLKIVEHQAAFGLRQLDRLPMFIEKRRRNWKYLSDHLKSHSDYLYLQNETENSKISPYGCAMVVRPDAPFKRIDMVRWLENHMIESRHLWAGDVRLHPAYRGFNFEVSGDLNNATIAKDGGFFVGCHPGMTKEMLDYIIEVFDDFIKKHRR